MKLNAFSLSAWKRLRRICTHLVPLRTLDSNVLSLKKHQRNLRVCVFATEALFPQSKNCVLVSLQLLFFCWDCWLCCSVPELFKCLFHSIVGMPGVLWVLPDSYIDVKNKDYGGQCNIVKTFAVHILTQKWLQHLFL